MRKASKLFAYSTAITALATGTYFIGYNFLTSDVNGAFDRSSMSAQHAAYKLQLASREEQWQKLDNEHFDVLVVGGGATGAGSALDAASRGLKTALVEKSDFGAGTSSRATKMAHGGVRYLEKAVMHMDYKELHFVYECLKERKHFFQVAPHLCSGLPLLTPCYSWYDSLKMFIGLRLYDILSGTDARIGKSEWVSATQTKQQFPALKGDGLVGSMKYYDGLFNDSRLNVSLALTTAALGGAVLNHAQVINLVKDETGKLVGAIVKDTITGKEHKVKAKVIVNATGAFSDGIRQMDDKDTPSIIKASSGVHIVLDPKFGAFGNGVLFPKTSDGRVMFLVPYENKVVAGTTDKASTISDTPGVDEASIDFILKHLQEHYSIPISRKDVLSSWAGIRPLVVNPKARDTANTAAIPRDHYIDVSPSGLVTIGGGKWTSFRKMSEDTVTKAMEVGSLGNAKSKSADTVLVGAQNWNSALVAGGINLNSYFDILDAETANHLKHFYGDRASIVAQYAKDQKLSSKLSPSLPHIEAEIAYHIDHEYACSATDVIAYRTSLMFLDRNETLRVLPRIVQIMGDKLKWDKKRREQEMQQAIAFVNACTK